MGTINFSGRDVTVKTLNMCELKEVLTRLLKKEETRSEQSASILGLHIVDLLFNDEVPAFALSMATGLSLEELSGKVSPEIIRELLDKTRAVNPFLVGMIERLVSHGRDIQAGLSASETASKAEVSH